MTEDKAAELRSGTTGWREAGDGEPLVFLHGLGGTRGSWNPQLAHFAATRHCVAWDMPGYGASTGESALTYERIADRLIELLDHLELESVDVVGLSFGGMHALHTALRYPERIRRMVLADTSPAFGMDGTSPEAWKAERLDAMDAGETPGSIAPAVLDAIVGSPLDPDTRADLIDAFGRIPVDGFRAAVECLPHNDIRHRLHTIAAPALVVVGELDEETPVSYAQALAEGLSDAELVVLSGVGHLSPSEDPDRFNRHVEEFLDTTSTDQGASP